MGFDGNLKVVFEFFEDQGFDLDENHVKHNMSMFLKIVNNKLKTKK